MEEEPTGISTDAVIHYPKIELPDYTPNICLPRVHEGCHMPVGEYDTGSLEKETHGTQDEPFNKEDILETSREDHGQKKDLPVGPIKDGKYFYYDTPLSEETGVWIPVSVLPLQAAEQVEWSRGLYSNGGYLPDSDLGWNECIGEDKEMTMWDVVLDILLTARGKISARASGDINGYTMGFQATF